MKIIASTTLYSGLKDPEMELNLETSKVICDLLMKASEASDKKIQSKLGGSGFLLYWSQEDCPTVVVRVFKGIICIQSFHAASYFKDTVGLEDYLTKILEPLFEAQPGSILVQ